MGNIFYFDWEVELIEWVQNAMGSVGTTLARLFSFIGGETMSLLLLIIMLLSVNKASKKLTETSLF